MSEKEHVVIIGGGIAGVFASSNLRRNDFKGKITIVERQHDIPYDRPPLTKEFLRGSIEEDELFLRKPSFYEDKDVNLKLGHFVTKIDPDNKKITLDNDESMKYTKLLITIGARLNHLDSLDEHQFENVFYIRTKEDSKRLKEEIEHIDHLAIFGGGFIGLEVAASLIALGKKVTLIVRSETPLIGVLGEEMGKYVADYHRSKGVEIITGDYAVEYMGDGKVTGLITNNGKKVKCDGILVSIGVTPDLSIFEDILDCDEDGITVDEYNETSISHIYAAGDCARWRDPISHEMIRVEHWDHAFNHGRNAALNIIEPKSVSFNKKPYFWSDQYDLNLEYLGHPVTWDKTVLRGDKKDNKFVVYYLNKNKLVGALFVNSSKEVKEVRKVLGKDFE